MTHCLYYIETMLRYSQPLLQYCRILDKISFRQCSNSALNRLKHSFSKTASFNSLLRSSCILLKSHDIFVSPNQLNHWRLFRSEAEFHLKADDTLDEIQELLEDAIEDIEEIVLASGVLTFVTPRGTWVLNKQTPNKQIWWSSPISGPRRYEYNDENDIWVNTRDGSSLYESLKEEMLEVYGIEL